MPDEPQSVTPDQSDAIEERCGPVLDPILLIVAILWGGNFVAYKYLMNLVSASGLLALRCTLITAMLLVVLALRGRLRSGNSRGMWLRIGLAGVLVMGLQQVCFVTGLDLTAAGEGSLLFSTAPIFTALIAAALGYERISLANWVGIAAAMVGCALVILGGEGAEHVPPTRVKGDLFMIASSICYALFMVISGPLMRRYGALKVLTFSFFFALPVILPFGLADALADDWASIGLIGWVSLFWVVVLAGTVGFTAWYWRISRTSASRVAVYQYFVPVVAMITAALLLSERPAALQILGAGFVLLGLYFARRRDAANCPT